MLKELRATKLSTLWLPNSCLSLATISKLTFSANVKPKPWVLSSRTFLIQNIFSARDQEPLCSVYTLLFCFKRYD